MTPPDERCLGLLAAADAAAAAAWTSGVDTDEFVGSYSDLVDCWRSLDAPTREQIADLSEGQGRRGLLWFASQAANRAHNSGERIWIERAVLAIMLEGGRHEPRESLLALGLIDHAAGRIGLVLAEVVDSLRHYATGGITRAGLHVVDGYLRSPMTLEQLGVVEADTPQGVRYRSVDHG
jgi:hypothetical protein